MRTMKQLGFRVLDLLLQAASFGRKAVPGKLYQIKKPYMMNTLFLRPQPGEAGNKSMCNHFSLSDQRATFLVLKVETNKPIWHQWVQVLFTDSEDTWTGWIPYHEFNRMVHAEWFNQWAD